MAGLMALFGLAASCKAVDFHVATAQDLQNALTLAAASSVSNNIYVTNGYYTGNFNFNSSNVNELTLLAEPGVSNTQITIDSGGTGSSLSMTATASPYITVQGMTFLRNCGNTTIGGLQMVGGNTAILVNGCQFLSPSNSSGIGLNIFSGLNATLTNCIVAGYPIGGGGIGISISGITNNVMLQNCTLTSNRPGGFYFPTGTGAVAITGSLFTGNSGGISFGNGGGASLNATTITISGNTFTSNDAGAGGGFTCSGTTITVSSNTFTGNSGGGAGGGVNCNGATVTLTGNIFTGNFANGSGNGYSGQGGGASCDGYDNLTLLGNTFTSNSTSGGGIGGGGAFCGGGGTVTLSNNIFIGNSANGGLGGGAYCYPPNGPISLMVSGNTFEQNTAVSGGGLYATGPTINLLDNLVAKNTGEPY